MLIKKIKIIKNTIIYSASNYIVIFFGFFISILSKKILGVEGSGQWAILTIFLSYGLIFGSLGIEIAITREIPQAKGRGEHLDIEQMINTGFTFTFIIGLLISIFYIFVSNYFVKDLMIKKGLVLTTALMVVTLLYNLNLSILRGKKFITALSQIMIINILLVGVFPLTLAYFYGVIGYVLGTTISTFLSFFISRKIGLINYKWMFDIRKAIKLIIIGFPMLIAGVLQNTFLGLDKIIIGSMLGTSALGLYTIALMSTQQLTSLPRFFQTVLFPYVQEDYGKNRSIEDLRPYFIKSMYIISRLLPFIIGLIIFFIPVIVLHFLPKFKDGLMAMQILVCGFYFAVISETSGMFIYTINKQRVLPFLYGIMLALSAGLNYFAILKGWGISGVALASSIAYFIFFIIESAYAYLHLMKVKEMITYFARLIVTYFYILLVIIAINRTVIIKNEISQLTCRLSLFCLFYLPIFIIVEKRESLFSAVAGIVSGYFRKKKLR